MSLWWQAVTGFSPLGAGSYVELSMATPQESALSDATVVDLAKGKGVSPAQIILKWALQRDISVVPKSTKLERLEQNLALDEFMPEANTRCPAAHVASSVPRPH